VLDIELNDGSQNRLAGFYTINEERLAALTARPAGRLHEAGYLQAIYMAVASLSQFRVLIDRKNRPAMPMLPSPAAIREIDMAGAPTTCPTSSCAPPSPGRARPGGALAAGARRARSTPPTPTCAASTATPPSAPCWASRRSAAASSTTRT
jgi:hypothetical protein